MKLIIKNIKVSSFESNENSTTERGSYCAISDNESSSCAKRKNMCVSCYISKKIRVGRSLLFFFLDFTKKHSICIVCMKYITKRGSFWGYLLTIQNGFLTVQAFHRMNLNQNKCLNSNSDSNMIAKVAKPINNGHK